MAFSTVLRAAFIAPLILPMLVDVSIAECKDGEIWATSQRDMRVVTYFPGGFKSPDENPLVFEGWQGDRIHWRVRGSVSCSNGVVVCGMSVPLSDGEAVNAPVTHIFEGDETPYVVFADLAQLTFRAQGYQMNPPHLVAEWFVEKPADLDVSPIVLPNYYRFVGCQTGGELEAGKP